MPITRPGKPIDIGYARKLVDNYQKAKIGNALPDDETRAVWFGKETILSALGLDPATDTKEISGLRIYLGAYGEQPGYPENTFDQNKITLVIVQTGQSKITINRGAVEENAYLDIINNPATLPDYPNAGSPAPDTGFNEGQAAPPPGAAKGLGLMDW